MTPTLGTKLDCLATLDPTDAGFAVDAVNAILTLAVGCGASDVHVQPRSEGWEVLLRVDGVLSVRGE